MKSVIQAINAANALEIEEILKAVLHRYAVLYPDWEVSTISLHKCENRNEQLARTISTLQTLITTSSD